MSIKRFWSAACGLLFLIVCAFIASPSGPPVASSQVLPLDTATSTPTAGPSCLMVTGSTPRCYWPNTLNYYFAFYNSCNTGLTGSGTVQLEVAANSGGPWIVYDQANVNQSFPPGSSYTSGNFVENNIPPEYHVYRFSITLNTSNGQTLNGTTVFAPLCNTPTTPTPTPTGITIRCYMVATGAQSTCSQPDAYWYNFGIYSHCDTTMPGTVQVQFQVSANQGGPWTVYDTQTSSRTYSPGVNTVQGTFIEGAIPSQYQWYRITMSASYPGAFGSRYVTSETQPAAICTGAATATVTVTVSPTHTSSSTTTSGIPSPSPTIGPPCGILTFGNPGTTYCTSPNDYYYSFTFYVESGCPTTMNGTATVTFEVAPDSSGPWTAHDTQTYPVTFQRGWNGSTGTFNETAIPSQYQWYRINYIGRFPNNVNAYSVTNPAPRCDLGTATPATMTPSPIPSGTSTPATCSTNYTYATATATIVPGTIDTGNHCDDCLTQITLPFSYQLYDQSFTSVYLESNGSASFSGSIPIFPVSCLPQPGLTYIVFPYREDLRTDCPGCGIYTSISGTAPNRIFNIEWRANYFPGNGPANFELRLYEGQPRFDVIYVVLPTGNSGSLVGVQKDNTYFTQYFCNGQGGDITNGRLVIYTLPVCSTPTTVPPTYTSSPVATTATPETTHTATVTGTPILCNLSFTDVPPDNTFYAQVRCLACRGIVSGYSDGTFRPNNQVTRGQLAKMVSNAAGFSEDPNPQIFQDVPATHTFYEFINRLTRRGHMTGYQCGGPGEPCVNNMPYFRPQNNATRGQTSKIVANAAQIETYIPPDQQTFEDVPPNHTFWLWIERLATRSVMSGYECGRPGEPCIAPENRPYFRPGNDVTRGQSSKIVANVFFPGCDIP